MKKIKFLLLLFIMLVVFFSCTVSESTGCIQVKNTTYMALTDVKIGDTLIASYVAAGNYVNYWYYQPIEGKLTTKGIEVDKSVEDITLSLKPNFWVYITAEYTSDGNEVVGIKAVNQGESSTDRDDWQKD